MIEGAYTSELLGGVGGQDIVERASGGLRLEPIGVPDVIEDLVFRSELALLFVDLCPSSARATRYARYTRLALNA